MAEATTVAKVSEIPLGKSKLVTVGSEEVALFNVSGVIHAIENRCAHRGGSLAAGFLTGCKVECPWHGWLWDLKDGTTDINPELKARIYKVIVEGDEVKLEV